MEQSSGKISGTKIFLSETYTFYKNTKSDDQICGKLLRKEYKCTVFLKAWLEKSSGKIFIEKNLSFRDRWFLQEY